MTKPVASDDRSRPLSHPARTGTAGGHRARCVAQTQDQPRRMGEEAMPHTVIGVMAVIPLVQVATMSQDHIMDESNQVAIADQEMTWRTPSIS